MIKKVMLVEQINPKLKEYMEQEIFPIYEKNEEAHGMDHILHVIQRSLLFARQVETVDVNMVYTIACFHDIGHHIDPKNHEVISAELFYQDQKMKQFFHEEERLVIKEAIEDHRASREEEPRSIYGKIISSADRNHSVNQALKRAYCYNRNYHPEFTWNEVCEECYQYILKKFGKDGYAKMYFYDEEYEQFRKEIQELLSHKEQFVKRLQEVNHIDSSYQGKGLEQDNSKIKGQEHQMKLYRENFLALKTGTKTREYRLHDEKRKIIQVGDLIRFFCLPDLQESILTEVIKKEVFTNWYDCYQTYFEEDFKDDYATVEDVVLDTYQGGYYSEEETEKYGCCVLTLKKK